MYHHSICGPLTHMWSVVLAADGRSDGICRRRLGTVPRAEFPPRWSTTWRRRKKILIIAGYCNNEKSTIPNDGEKKSRGTCSPLGLPRDGFLACRMQGKIGLVYQQCRSRLFAKDEFEESTDDGVEEGGDDVKQHFDAGNNNNNNGGGRGGSGGSNNEEDGNVGDDNTNDGVPWSWLWSLLCKAAASASGFNRYERSGGITVADFGEELFHLIVREIVFAQRRVPFFELATGLAVLIPLMLPLFFVPFLDVIMGLSIGIVGLSIGLSGLVVAWLWRWSSHPDGDEQQEEDDDDDHDSPFLKESDQKQKRMWDHLQI